MNIYVTPSLYNVSNGPLPNLLVSGTGNINLATYLTTGAADLRYLNTGFSGYIISLVNNISGGGGTGIISGSYVPYEDYFGYSGLSISVIKPKNNAGWIFDTGGNTSIWWIGRTLVDSTNNLSVDWNNRRLTDGSSSAVLDWNSKQITGTWNTQSLNVYGNLKLNDYSVIVSSQTGQFASSANLFNTGNIISSWTGASTGIYYPLKSNPSGYVLTGNNNSNTIYPYQRLLLGSDGYSVMDWGQRKLYGDAFISNGATIDWNNTKLNGYAVGEPITLNWTSGRLYNINDSSVALDWKNRILSGNWNSQSLSVGGYSVITSNQTGNFGGGNVDTGSLTGVFYPLKNNISGFIIPSQTGQFAAATNLVSTGSYLFGLINASSAGVSSLNSASGAISLIGTGNISITTNSQNIYISGNTGSLTGVFYPYNSNPNNYLTSSSTGFLTGIFYPYSSNPLSYITSSQTGIFINTSMTGQFASSSNLFLTGSGLSNWTGNSINIYYPKTSNPSGYITTGQTGSFINTATLVNSGNYLYGLINASSAGVSSINSLSGALNILGTGNISITSIGQNVTISGNTGQLSSIFYPLNSNPSGYLTYNISGNVTISGSIINSDGSSIISGGFSHAEGKSTQAIGNYTHVEGQATQAVGDYCHAEGASTTADGTYGHAEGSHTNTSGIASHSEGISTSAIGNYCHAEGASTIAGGTYCHSEGRGTSSMGIATHSDGYYTIATGTGQLAIGKYNIQNPDSLVIIGNGSSTGNRSDLALFNSDQIIFNESLQVNSSGSFASGLSVNGFNLSEVYITKFIDFKITGNYIVGQIPSNKIFLIDSMEILTTDLNSPSNAPYISFGITGDYQSFTSNIQTTSNSKYSRHIFDNPKDAISGGSILTASILTASTATIHSGYFIYKGYLI